jgi:hypothetical protein
MSKQDSEPGGLRAPTIYEEKILVHLCSIRIAPYWANIKKGHKPALVAENVPWAS